MKRIFSIGRDPQCDIVIQDVTDVVSRVHALLRLESNGKMFIKDQSKNGTYINGMRVTSNVEIPVSRKDTISFANVRELDWSVIPDPRKKTMTIISFAALGVVVFGLLTWLVLSNNSIFKLKQDVIIQNDTVTKVDTLRDTVVKYKEVPAQSKPKQDQPKEPKEQPKDTVTVTGTEGFM